MITYSIQAEVTSLAGIVHTEDKKVQFSKDCKRGNNDITSHRNTNELNKINYQVYFIQLAVYFVLYINWEIY